MTPTRTPGPPSAPPSSTSATSRRLAVGAGCTWWAPAPASTTPWLSSVTTLSQVGGVGPGGGGVGTGSRLFQRAMALSEVDEAVLGGPWGMGTGTGWPVTGNPPPGPEVAGCGFCLEPAPRARSGVPDLQALVGAGLGSGFQARVGLQGVSHVSPSLPAHPLDSAGDNRTHFAGWA